MTRPTKITSLLGIGICLLVVFALWRPWGSEVSVAAIPSDSGKAKTVAGPSGDSVNESAAVVRLAQRRGDDSGALLGLSMPAPQSPNLLPSGSLATLGDDVREWMTAYGDLDSTRWVAMASKTGVVVPTQLSDPKQLEIWWESSLEAVQRIGFDPTRTASRLVRLSFLNDRPTRTSQCSTRHAGRPFLQPAIDAGALGVEVVFFGVVQEKSSGRSVPVEVAMTFAWNSQVAKWAVVRICIVEFPMGENDIAPLM